MATKKKDTTPVSVLRADQLQTKPKETAKKNTAPVSVLRAEQLLPAPKTEASAQRAQEALGIPYSAQRAAGYMTPAKNNIFSDTQREIFENATAFQKSFGTLDNFLLNKRTTKRGFFSRPEPTLGQSTAYHNAVLWDGAMQYQQKRVQDLAAQVSVLATGGPNVDRTGIYRDYVQAVNNYRSMIPQYNRAIDTYNGMAQAAKKLNEDWRKSIRPTDEIDKDVAALRQEIAAKWNERQTHAAQLTSNPDRLLPSALETRRKNEQAMVDRYDREIANLRKDEELLQEERFWSVFYQYEDNRNDPDFLNKATPKHQAIKGTLGEEAVWRAVNSDKEIGKNDTAARMIMGTLAPVSNLVGPDLAPRVMSDDEKQMFNYLWNEKSATEAVDYFKALKEDHLGRWARGEEEKYIREMAKNPLFGWKMSDLSVLMGPGKALGFLAQGIDYALDGTIDENAAYNRNTYAQRAIRDERADYYAKLAETKLGEGWGKLGSFGYQTAMSMADFIFNAAITGNFSVTPGTRAAKIAEELSLGIMSTGAAADATVEAKDRGLSDGQAIVLGTVAGFAEYFTEKVSLELLLDKVGSKSGWWYIAKNKLGEGSEEVASDLINLGADIWISQDKSEWQRAIRAYENQGFDKRTAFQKAWNDQARGMLLSFAGGAISGGVMAGASLSVGGVTPLELGQITDFTELERSAREAGASEEFTEMAKHYSALLGREIRAFSAEPTTNGFYDGKAIYINVNAKNPMEQVLGHELTHSIEEASDYTKFRQIVLDRLEKSGELDAMKEKVQRLYLSRGVELNEKKLDEEVVARYTEEHLLSDAAQIHEVVLQSRGFGHWMKGQIDALLAKLGNKDAQARTFLRRAQRYYQRALEATAGKESTGGGYSFAGEKAQTANKDLLDTAKDLETRGVSSEEIRRSTGWFRGMDGKWRFEIDDSGMSVKLPEYAFNRLRDLIRHDALFEAYPNLKDVEVYFTNEVGENEAGYYDRNLDRIVINKKYENDTETIKRILLHEIQHAIQDREGLARGATEEYWDAARERGYDTRTKAQRAEARDLWKEFDDIRQREPEFWQEMADLLREAPTVPRGKVLNWDTLESEPDPQEWVDFDQRREALKEQYGTSKVFGFMRLWDSIMAAEKYDRGTSSYELYRNTAGEIEARDTADRRDLTHEERMSDRPDIDRENVVFAPVRYSISEDAKLTDERIDFLVGGDGFGVYGKNEKYAQAYITSIDPRDFLKLTLSDSRLFKWNEAEGRDPDIYQLDKEKLKNAQMPYLWIDSTTREVVGHEGRHRMRALMNAGVKSVPIAVLDYDTKYSKTPAAEMVLSAQDFGDGAVNGGATVTLRNLIPTNPKYREQIRQAYGGDARVQFSISEEEDTDYMQAVERGDMETAQRMVDEAAKKTGYTVKAWHLGAQGITAFQSGNDAGLIYFGFSKQEAARAARTTKATYESYLHIENPVNGKANPINWYDAEDHLQSAKWRREGYDAVYVKDEAGVSVAVFNPEQIKSADTVTYDDNGNVIPLSERFNPENPDIRYSYAEEEDSQGRKLSENQAKFFENSKARDEQGRLLTLYHQTENDFTVFDPRHEGAGTRDNQTPYGIFLKSNTRDIGVRGKKQMALYANIMNPLVVENRSALEGRLREMSPEYADLSDQHRRLDSEYQKRFDEAQKKFRDFLTAWRAEHPDAGRTDVYEAEGFESAFGAADEVLKEWEAAARELETKTKNVITQVLEDQGYDGLFLQKDQGAWGRSTDAVVALRPEQVKNIDNQNPTKDKDIRYSLSETDSNGVVLTRQQAEYFKDSKARDKEGNLLTLYNGGFGGEVYGDRGAGLTYGLGRRRAIYMTDVRQVADAYGSGRSELTNELYANLKNPLILDAEGRNYTDIPIPDDAPESLIEMYAGIDDEITADADSLPDYAWENGYDGVIIYNVREGVGGGPMTEVIALSSEQVKRTDNEAPTDDRNIRYSLTEEPKGLELPSVDDAEINPAGAPETDGRLSLPKVETEETEGTKKPKTRKKPPKPVAESKPILARNWLNRQIMDQFGIRENKTEASKIIQQYADKVLREGAVTDVDVGNLFGQLYDRGVFEVFPDSYSKAMRELVTQGNIYTPDSVKAEFGDDWADFRRKAFDAGLMLTNTRSISDAKALGVDQIYKELSDMLPGLFQADEYDERTMLERIVQAAENGKSQKMTLPEYLAHMNKTEGEDMFEAADRMMDKIAEDMRTFGEMAGLEIKLRDRTGVKIAQERERFGEIREKHFQRISDARAQERERFRETTQRLRERKQISELQQKTLKQLQWLSKNRYRAPEELRGTWDELLGDLDIYAVHAADELHYSKKHDATYRDLIKMYKEAQATDPNFLPSKELERIMSRVDGEHLEDLDVDSLKNLYQAITGLRTEFYNRNNAIMENETAALSDIFDETRKKMTAQRGYTDRAISRILNEESLTPMNALRRMVGWDKNSAWVQMAKQLEKGEKVRRDYKVRAERLLEDFLDENKDWFAKADGIGKDAIWYEVKVPEFMEFGKGNKPIFGDTVSVWMTPLQKVHMYLESKSYDNLRHMLGGRTFADKELYSQGERARAFAAGRTIKLAPETVKYLVKDLSPEEMKLAKILENYYNVWSKGRINEVSNKLYGYDKAMNANYAPILTNQNYVGKELGVGDATAAGVGNLKARIYSKNPSYNVSAIEAFERSVDQTGKFVGMAIAESNWQKLLNWQVKGNSMRDVITHTWDKRGLDYIENLIETLQGNRTRDGKLVLGESTNKLLSNYISAAFGSNPGIVFKQAASYPQFAAVLGWSTAPNPKQFFKIDTDLINTYTSELAYRQMGYATPETAQLKNNPGLLQRNKALNFVFGGGSITAMDAATVKRGWAWAENAVKRDFPDLDKGTEAQIKAGKSEYYKKVAEYFEDAVSTTQPMYDEMHRPYIMKEAKGVARAFTMFKTVPMQQYNTLRRMWGEYDFARKQYQADSSAENKEQLRQAARGAANAVTATVGSVVALELVELLNQLWKNRAKGYRDDDDELTAASIGEAVAIKSVEDFAGMVPAGKEIAQILENLFMGKKWYGIEIPGGEQLNDFIETVQDTYKQIAGFVSGSFDVIRSGEDWGQFLRRHAREYAGAAKDLVQNTAMYFRGLPLENLEKYVMGAVQFSPELTAAVEDVFKNPGKSDLKGLRGHMLRRKIEDVMTIRGVELSKMASDYLSTKYQNGVNVIPTDTPKEITVDGEPVKLTESQKLKYERAWAVAGQDINTLITSRDFQQADEATQQRMIGRLYAYATEEAKKAALGSYEQDTVAARAHAVIRAGGTAAQWAMLDATTNFQGAKDVDAYDAIARSSAPESVKRAMFGAIKGTALTTESGEPTAYAKMQTVTAAGMTVSAYARWLAESGDKKTAEKIDLLKQFGYSDQIKRAIIETMSTDKQQEKMQQIVESGLSVDGYLDIRANGAEDEYIKLLKNGIKGEKAAQAAILAQQIKDEAGPGATDLEKLRVAIDRSRSTKEQMDALTAILTTDQCRPYVVGNKMGVTPDIMVTAKEKMRDYDADQNGSYKNDEVTAMIEGVYGSGGKLKLPGSGTLSNDQKAVLWQLLTGSTSAKNNPYSVEIGNQVLAAKAAQKETDGKLKLPG